MDFSYHYTQEQQGFRQEVSAWLDRNVPAAVDALLDSPDRHQEVRHLRMTLGRRGWLAPTETAENGGAGLDSDLIVVLLEELNHRGLLSLVQDETQSLRTALRGWSSTDNDHTLSLSLASGSCAVWRQQFAVSPRAGAEPRMDPDSVGVTATPDGDGFILNGTGLFTGGSARPDILWTLALVQPYDVAQPGATSAVCLIVDPTTVGITYPSVRRLIPSAARPVRFDSVWVLRTDKLGAEGEGHRVLGTRVSLDSRADLPSWIESETEALVDYARSTDSMGSPLSADPIRARILVEAYIASRVSRLLRMRSQWLRQSGQEAQTASSVASLWRRKAAAELSDTARQVVGPRALLSSDDPRTADAGRFDRLSRREVVERSASGDSDREAIASKLGLGEPVD